MCINFPGKGIVTFSFYCNFIQWNKAGKVLQILTYPSSYEKHEHIKHKQCKSEKDMDILLTIKI